MMDYIDMFNRHDAEMERKLADCENSRPKCECCGEVILDDFATCIDDEWFCDEKECRAVAMEALWDKHKSQYNMRVA